MLPYIIGAAVVGAIGKHGYEKHKATDHNWILRKACKKAKKATSDSATILVDHVDDKVDADGNCAGELGADYVPDLIVKDFDSQNLVVEVETSEGLENDPEHAVAQLEAFATPGYRRVLICDDTDVGEEFVSQRGLDRVVVCKASKIGRLL